jgi:hypothetical protein
MGDKSKGTKWQDSLFTIIISLVGVSISMSSCYMAHKANKFSERISSITNRPYILYDPIGFAYEDMHKDQDNLWINIGYSFKLKNNGTLPAWVFKYDFYVSGENNIPIRVPFSPVDKPTNNFSIGMGKDVEGSGIFNLKQNIENDPAKYATGFIKKQNKFILLVTRYKTLGDDLNNEIFTYWELFIFNAEKTARRIECGTSNLDEVSIRKLFIEQDKRFKDNNAV